jgi:DNA-binding IclR family transcriptional regulator
VIYTDKIDGDGTVAMGSRIGLSAELHTAAVAKVTLSFLSDAQLSRMLDHHDFLRHTRITTTSREAFQAELQATRKRWWAEDQGEKEDYINCVALPLFDASGRVTLRISVTALRAAAPVEELRELIPLILGTTLEISRELGWKGDVRGFE